MSCCNTGNTTISCYSTSWEVFLCDNFFSNFMHEKAACVFPLECSGSSFLRAEMMRWASCLSPFTVMFSFQLLFSLIFLFSMFLSPPPPCFFFFIIICSLIPLSWCLFTSKNASPVKLNEYSSPSKGVEHSAILLASIFIPSPERLSEGPQINMCTHTRQRHACTCAHSGQFS